MLSFEIFLDNVLLHFFHIYTTTFSNIMNDESSTQAY